MTLTKAMLEDEISKSNMTKPVLAKVNPRVIIMAGNTTENAVKAE
jgi:hypothetical protein